MLIHHQQIYTKQVKHYISGTGGKDGSINRDIMDDLFLVPRRNVHHSEKYKDAMKEINENPEISRLVGHSLASAVKKKQNQSRTTPVVQYHHLCHTHQQKKETWKARPT